jgi:peptide/nickel transport system permease protein
MRLVSRTPSKSPSGTVTASFNVTVRQPVPAVHYPKSKGFLVSTLDRLVHDRVAMLGAALVAIVVIGALVAPFAAPYDPTSIDPGLRLSPPSPAHPLGTDELGRDLLSRLLFGARVSLLVGVSAVALSTVVGVAIGLFSGYYSGPLDGILMRLMDILLAFPGLVLALALLAVLGPDVRNLILALVIGSVPGFARLARGAGLVVTAEPYVESARAAGATGGRILLRYILPNCLAPILVSATAALGGLILAEAGLSFLGLGVQPPTPSWGMMLSTGRAYMQAAPFVAMWPGLAIFVTVLGFNLLGDGVRDATDPRLRRL